MLAVIAYVALVVTAAGLLLGTWHHTPRPRGRHRADRQLLRLIRHTDRRTAR